MTSVITRDYYELVQERASRERFLEKVSVSADGCWVWTAKIHKDGYGQIKVGGRYGKTLAAHRVSWMMFRGRIPNGLYVLHSCDTRSCVNPEHLFTGTAQHNTDDMLKKGRGQDYSKVRKISDEQAVQMQKMHASGGVTYKEVGEAFNVSNAQAWRICNGTRG